MTVTTEETNRLLLEKLSQMALHQGGSQDDPMFLANSDNPGTVVGTVQFTGKNFLPWSRSLRLGLKTKSKLGFLDGSVAKPKDDSPNLHRWNRADSMVACWILGSMKPEIAASFVYTDTAKDLWNEILDRFAQKNIPMLYQLKVDLMKTVQGNSSATEYYSKLKSYWDDLKTLNGVPVCTCGALNGCSCGLLKRFRELEEQEQLMKFLSGLNPSFEHTKNQILGTDPVVTVSKAYSIVLAVETQKEGDAEVPESTAFNVLNTGQRRNNGFQPSSGQGINSKGRSSDKKVCSHCNKTGHVAGDCFELKGYPDWWKGKKSGKYAAANRVDVQNEVTPLESDDTGGQDAKHSFDPSLVQALCQEMMRAFKGKMPVISNYAGPGE